MKFRVVASAVVFNGNKILMGRKPTGVGPYPDTWIIPGGGVNLGEETCEEAVIREIGEETGISIKNLQKIDWDTDTELDKNGQPTYYVFVTFKCEYAGGKLKPDDDVKHLEWIETTSLKKYSLSRPSTGLFRRLGLIK